MSWIDLNCRYKCVCHVLFQAKLCECIGNHHTAHSSPLQGVTVWPGLSFPHREHIQCHQDRWGTFREEGFNENMIQNTINVLPLFCLIPNANAFPVFLQMYYFNILKSDFPSFQRQRELFWACLSEVWSESSICGDRGWSRRRGRGQEGITQSGLFYDSVCWKMGLN